MYKALDVYERFFITWFDLYKCNIENFRNIVVPDVEEKILNEALVDDVTLNNFLDKLSVEDMIEIYKTIDVNSFLQRFQRA